MQRTRNRLAQKTSTSTQKANVRPGSGCSRIASWLQRMTDAGKSQRGAGATCASAGAACTAAGPVAGHPRWVLPRVAARGARPAGVPHPRHPRVQERTRTIFGNDGNRAARPISRRTLLGMNTRDVRWIRVGDTSRNPAGSETDACGEQGRISILPSIRVRASPPSGKAAPGVPQGDRFRPAKPAEVAGGMPGGAGSLTKNPPHA
ncbi:MAG: hypothetical protein RL272_128 [Candidatus Parcubacteria bacterium]